MNFDNSQHSQNKTKTLPSKRSLGFRPNTSFGPAPSLGSRPIIGGGGKFWETLDGQFIKVFDASVGTYYINKQINKIIVILGIVLIAYALIYHTYSSFLDNSDSITSQQSPIDNNGTNDNKLPDITALISGGAGIASLITLFFYKS